MTEHSTISNHRPGYYRDCDGFEFVFESVVVHGIKDGLMGDEGFAVAASLIRTDAYRKRGFPGGESVD